jgi:hypothetical protein
MDASIYTSSSRTDASGSAATSSCRVHGGQMRPVARTEHDGRVRLLAGVGRHGKTRRHTGSVLGGQARLHVNQGFLAGRAVR